MKHRVPLLAVTSVLLLAATVLVTSQQARDLASKARGRYTVEDRIRLHSKAVESRVKSKFLAKKVAYPPTRLAYVAFKDSMTLEVYAKGGSAPEWRKILTYPILRASGKPGPKLREGDLQVPEGIYKVEFLNANSKFHLSLRLNYPNEFDLKHAKAEGRTQPGTDIMIHGSAVSIGCLAMGDEAAEDLFILAALTGRANVEIVIAPYDFRVKPISVPAGSPAWLRGLYQDIGVAIRKYPSH